VFEEVCVFWLTLHKRYKFLHVPSNSVYVSRDVIFDENVFPFVNVPNSQALPSVSEFSLLSADHFMNVAHASSLLADHGADIGLGSRLKVLILLSPPLYVD
jgi:hypothetical protein